MADKPNPKADIQAAYEKMVRELNQYRPNVSVTASSMPYQTFTSGTVSVSSGYWIAPGSTSITYTTTDNTITTVPVSPVPDKPTRWDSGPGPFYEKLREMLRVDNRRIALDKLPNGFTVSSVVVVQGHGVGVGLVEGSEGTIETAVFNKEGRLVEKRQTVAFPRGKENHEELVAKYRAAKNGAAPPSREPTRPELDID
jgi:hypothetical protein